MQLLQRSRNLLRSQLKEFDQQHDGDKTSTVYIYKMFLAKERAMYTQLNKMQWQNQTFTGFFWAPEEDQEFIRQEIEQFGAVRINALQDHKIMPPTYFKLNELTFAFQELVNTYSIPKYREGNPALITIVTYPFLFGMMYGDMGHGSIWLMFALFLCSISDKVRGTPLEGLNLARFFLLLMGIMATYCGFIYNECFAIQMNMWGSCYDLNKPSDMRPNPVDSDKQVYRRKLDGDCTYYFGQDPVWSISSNSLVFSNGVKMKASVIVGVLHMSFGIFIKLLNQIQTRDCIGIFADVICGFVILWGLFGWMDVLIIQKWFASVNMDDITKTVPAPDGIYTRNGQPVPASDVLEYAGEAHNRNLPSIISMIIGSLLPPSPCPSNLADLTPISGDSLCNSLNVSFVLVLAVFICAPAMLCTKPCVVKCSGSKHSHVGEAQYNAIEGAGEGRVNNALNNNGSNEGLDDEQQIPGDKVEDMMAKRIADDKSLQQKLEDMSMPEESHEFGDVFIHSMIHTIEFVLGTVSNTASYLRLWALSLAHGQLSEVFFNLTFTQFYSFFGLESMGLTIVIVSNALPYPQLFAND